MRARLSTERRLALAAVQDCDSFSHQMTECYPIAPLACSRLDGSLPACEDASRRTGKLGEGQGLWVCESQGHAQFGALPFCPRFPSGFLLVRCQDFQVPIRPGASSFLSQLVSVWPWTSSVDSHYHQSVRAWHRVGSGLSSTDISYTTRHLEKAAQLRWQRGGAKRGAPQGDFTQVLAAEA